MDGPRVKLLILSHVVALGLGAGVTAVVQTAANNKRAAVPASTPSPAPVPEVEPAPLVQIAPPPLNRAELLATAAKAADTAAGGNPLPLANRDLVGRSFTIRMPFGCAGPETDGTDSWAGWTYNEKTRALRLTARPAMLEAGDWAQDRAAATAYDAVEGFWIDRPWTSSESCGTQIGKEPPQGTGMGPQGQGKASGDRLVPSRQLAIAMFYAPGASRTRQRGGRPYTSTIKLEGDEAPSTRGYTLVLSGRLAALDDGQPVRCLQRSPDIPPRCIISVTFDKVAFEQPGRDKPLVEWR
ncbi:hypothetical protein GR702_17015 [Novosphingobium sp. FGD1]|uniref:Uncharacterized protein n=1 Tax=Novosphingobium silvae TaxID=2692619 RepID=A0A7X4K9K2_9SPHN|nr:MULTISPECIES: hypothetical protein [Novosphingobium]MYL99473.1 hypothetical protein [Novosphingobium silvae]GFE76955.1 hypothetical protein NTCA1_46040 [Novosphingobium sp. TCA1]